MVGGQRKVQRTKPRRESDVRKPDEGGSQGIVRDQRGQEQPADKERAQQASKTGRDG